MTAASAVASRRPGAIEYEAARAMLSMAGVRMLSQDYVTGAGAASDNTYTVVNSNTRRVLVYIDHATNVCRWNMNAAATVHHLPLVNQTYFVVDAHGPLVKPMGGGQTVAIAADVIHFYDVTGGTVVNFVELD